jgi:hypothetical protein
VNLPITMGSSSTFGGIPMLFTRNAPRISDTQDLFATLPPTRRHIAARGVLNLCEGGMLVAGGELEVGKIAKFELAGPDFRSTGLAEVIHHNDGATGLRFIHWHAAADGEMRDLIAAKVLRQQLESAARTIPGCYLG